MFGWVGTLQTRHTQDSGNSLRVCNNVVMTPSSSSSSRITCVIVSFFLEQERWKKQQRKRLRRHLHPVGVFFSPPLRGGWLVVLVVVRRCGCGCSSSPGVFRD